MIRARDAKLNTLQRYKIAEIISNLRYYCDDIPDEITDILAERFANALIDIENFSSEEKFNAAYDAFIKATFRTGSQWMGTGYG